MKNYYESDLFLYAVSCFCAGLFVLIWGFYLPDPAAILVGVIAICLGFFLMLVLAVRAKERFGG